MNKEQFIKQLAEATELSDEQCLVVNNVLENHFPIGKNNHEKIVAEIEAQLGVTKEDAEKVYEAAMAIVGDGIKNKLKHPFGAQD